ncbi:MAG TPA: Uma2 family endonuclease [Gemmatimonadales bacterium]|nr:Uma2 family endonuclease [Gemmatimonadales bacterium]
MPAAKDVYTVDDVRQMPDDGNRYEIIAGELLVTPAPGVSHQTVLARLFRQLADYVERHRLGEIWFAPVDVVFGPHTLVEPDLLFVAGRRAEVVTEREVLGAPDLAVEVLSPSSARTDRGKKRALYQETGVREYWVVDVSEHAVETWRPGATRPEVARVILEWRPDPAVAPLRIDLAALFRPRRLPA